MSSGASILLVDDNPAIARAIEIALRLAGHRLDHAVGPEEALSLLARRRYGAILLDLNFSPGAAGGQEGLACLARIMADDPGACVVVITAHSGIRLAVAAMQAGARDFLMKPWRNAELVAKIEAAMARAAPPAPATTARADDGEAPPVLLGDSAAMQRVRDLVRRVAPTSAGITVTGPPGSGRMLTARAIHAASNDAGEPPVRVDLRGEDWWPYVERPSGTLILRHPDQLDALSQDRLAERLAPSVRTIAVADDLAALTPALRRRIGTLEVAVPPLAERGDDAVLLARHFASAAAERFGRPPVRLSEAALAAVRTTGWTDEVRGLALAIERAVLLADGDIVDAATLAPAGPVPTPAATTATETGFALVDAEKTIIEAALREHRHNVTTAAAALGISRGALYRRMARHGL